MMRLALGAAAGVLVGGCVIAGVEAVGHAVFGDRTGAPGSQTPEELPFGVLLSVLAAWSLGVLAGSVVALRVSHQAAAAWTVTAVLFGAAAYTMVTVQHPLWFVLASVGFVFAAVLGAQRWLAPPATA